MSGPRKFTCIVFCYEFRGHLRVVHWHWPQSAIVDCPRSAAAFRRHLDLP